MLYEVITAALDLAPAEVPARGELRAMVVAVAIGIVIAAVVAMAVGVVVAAVIAMARNNFV